jgi:RNA polymerase sigma-70 factor, ECF subfamily
VKVVEANDSKQDGPVESVATQPARALPRCTLDAELVQRCVIGERSAARALHVRYYPVAAAFLRKLGTRPEEMEDACQEVFLQFFRYLASFRGEAQLKTWLYRLCVTEARRLRRRRRLSTALAAVLMRERRDEAIPAAASSEATMRKLVERALDRMGEGHRLVFVLFEMEGLPGKQVAEIAGCPEATVWRRLHDARRVFRETLGIDPTTEERMA